MTIHFWNTRALADELARDQVQERDAFLYFLANSVMWTTVLYYSIYWGARGGWLFFYEFAVALVITVFGLLRCYEANGAARGSHFVLRATCLSFPIGLKVNSASILLGWALFYLLPQYVDATLFRDPGRVYDLISFTWVAAFTFLFYWRLWVHLAMTRRHAPSPG